MPDAPPQLDDVSERDAETDAYLRGKREAYVQGELDSHEKRLDAVNGSIDRHAKNAEALRLSIEKLRGEVSQISATLATQAAVEQDRNKQLERANNQQISNRTFWLGVIAIIATLAAAVIASHGIG